MKVGPLQVNELARIPSLFSQIDLLCGVWIVNWQSSEHRLRHSRMSGSVVGGHQAQCDEWPWTSINLRISSICWSGSADPVCGYPRARPTTTELHHPLPRRGSAHRVCLFSPQCFQSIALSIHSRCLDVPHSQHFILRDAFCGDVAIKEERNSAVAAMNAVKLQTLPVHSFLGKISVHRKKDLNLQVCTDRQMVLPHTPSPSGSFSRDRACWALSISECECVYILNLNCAACGQLVCQMLLVLTAFISIRPLNLDDHHCWVVAHLTHAPRPLHRFLMKASLGWACLWWCWLKYGWPYPDIVTLLFWSPLLSTNELFSLSLRCFHPRS